LNVLVDTSIWSLALRRRGEGSAPQAAVLAELVREGRAVLIGNIRQELLSGIKLKAQYDAVRDRLRAFSDIELESADYEEAAAFTNHCMSGGIQGSGVDFLICAVAARRGFSILTADKDFGHYAKLLPIKLIPSIPAA